MNKERNFKLWPLALALSLGFIFSARSQTIMGYVNLPVYAGDNLIAVQLSDGAGNLINSVLTNGALAVGSTFTEQDPATQQLLPKSVWNGSSWTINYELGPTGIGGILNSPVATSVFFAGSLVNFTEQLGYDFVPPARSPGVYLLTMAAPISGDFQQIVGRAPVDGDAVETLDAATQTYQTTTYLDGAWNNGTPDLTVGEAAYFELEVPEPSTLVLSGLGAAMMAFRCSRWRIFRRSAATIRPEPPVA